MPETGLVKREVDVQLLISQGLEKGANIEVMERLFAMAKEMKAMSAREQFFESLAKFQKTTPKIIKAKEVVSKAGKVVYKYAPLDCIIDQVKDSLDLHGFSYTLKTKQEGGHMTVTCEAHHIGGHTESTDVTVPVGSEYMTAQQQVGAALTFAKRYAFCDAFGIMTGDEDTDAVGEQPEQEVKPKHEDAPPFPKEEHKPSAIYVETFNKVKAEFESQTINLDKTGVENCFKNTCKSIWGEKKYYKSLERFTVDELNTFYEYIMKK